MAESRRTNTCSLKCNTRSLERLDADDCSINVVGSYLLLGARESAMSKTLILLSIFIVTCIIFAPVNVLAEEPHTPDLRPSQPHRRMARPQEGQDLSLNWAGYAVSGAADSVSDVKGSWKVPSLACSQRTTYAALWVGMDGFDSNTVEQTGVLAECYRGEASYFTWYEFYPSYPVYITSSVPVKAGDIIYGDVSYASGLFTVTLIDQTTGKYFRTSQSDSSAQRSSAEWIMEAPSSGGVLSLADFSTAYYGYDYTSVALTSYATINGVTRAIGSFGSAVYEINMVTMILTVKAQPSTLSSDGTSFTVKWDHS